MWMAQAPGMKVPPKAPGLPWSVIAPEAEEIEEWLAEEEIGAALGREKEEWVQ